MRFVPRSLCCGMWLVLIPCVSAALTHVAHPHEYSSKALIDRSEPATMQSDTNSLGSSQSTETSLSGRRASGQFSAKETNLLIAFCVVGGIISLGAIGYCSRLWFNLDNGQVEAAQQAASQTLSESTLQQQHLLPDNASLAFSGHDTPSDTTQVVDEVAQRSAQGIELFRQQLDDSYRRREIEEVNQRSAGFNKSKGSPGEVTGAFSLLLSGPPHPVQFSARKNPRQGEPPGSSSPDSTALISKGSPPARKAPEAPGPWMEFSSDSYVQHLRAKTGPTESFLGAELANTPTVEKSDFSSGAEISGRDDTHRKSASEKIKTKRKSNGGGRMRNMMDANSSSDSDTSDVTEPLADGDAGAETSTTAVIDQAATAEPAEPRTCAPVTEPPSESPTTGLPPPRPPRREQVKPPIPLKASLPPTTGTGSVPLPLAPPSRALPSSPGAHAPCPSSEPPPTPPPKRPPASPRDGTSPQTRPPARMPPASPRDSAFPSKSVSCASPPSTAPPSKPPPSTPLTLGAGVKKLGNPARPVSDSASSPRVYEDGVSNGRQWVIEAKDTRSADQSAEGRETAMVIEANGEQELARATQAYSDQGAGEVKRLQQRINELKLKNQTPEGAAV